MADKLKSRKFWITFVVSALLLFAKQLGLDLDEQTVWGLVALATGYNAGQGYVDGKAQSAKANEIFASVAGRAVEPKKEPPEPEPDAKD